MLLNDRLEYVLDRVQHGEMVAVHHLDLDQFKAVNDTFGHPCGDKLLRIVAERLRGLVGEADTIARMGGDEFVIVQATIADPADATSLAQAVIDALSEPYDIIDGQQAVIGVSIGISVGPGDGSSPDKLLRNADLALYRAKSDGRGTFRFFEPVMDLQMQTRRIMEQDLRKALPAGEFELHYQPVVNLASKEISGFEALIRWNHPSKGMISPADFIPLAEEIGFIVPMGEWVIRQACATAARWPDDLHVAVNISAIQFRSPGLMQVIVSALAASGLAPTRLGDRNHRERPAPQQGSDARGAASVAGARDPDRDGRFRHRIFVADLPAELSVRQDQDRPLVRQEHHREFELAQHRAGGRRARQWHGHDGYRRGRGNRGAAPQHRFRRMHGDAGLPVLSGRFPPPRSSGNSCRDAGREEVQGRIVAA